LIGDLIGGSVSGMKVSSISITRYCTWI